MMTKMMNRNKEILYGYFNEIHDELVDKVNSDFEIFMTLKDGDDNTIHQRFGSIEIGELIYSYLSEYYEYKQNLLYFEYLEDYQLCEMIFYTILPSMKETLMLMINKMESDEIGKLAWRNVVEMGLIKLNDQFEMEYGEK